MDNREEVRRRLYDARDCLHRAEILHRESDWRGVIQNAQLCIELSAKAFISYFQEPQWRHDVGDQLKKIITKNKNTLEAKCGKNLIDQLKWLSYAVDEAAPWHAWSVYGKEEDSGWTSATELCRKDVADKLLGEAKRAEKLISNFFKKIEE